MGFKYDATGVDPDMKFTPAPAGDYTLVVREANPFDKEGQPRKSKNGDRMVSVRCEIDDANEYLGTTVWHNVTFIPKERKGAGMAVNFLKTIGEPWEGDIEVDPENWVGKTFRAKLKVEIDMKGNPRNQIQFLINDKKDEKEEEVPF